MYSESKKFPPPNILLTTDNFKTRRSVGRFVLAQETVYTGGAHWRHQANTTERSVRGGDAALWQSTSTTRCCRDRVKERSRRSSQQIRLIV